MNAFQNVVWHKLSNFVMTTIWCCVPVSFQYSQGPSYPGLTSSISWLLMPWLLASPGHQHPCYWLCKMGNFLSSIRKGFHGVHSLWRNGINCEYMFIFLLKNWACYGLKLSHYSNAISVRMNLGQVTKLWLSCYLVLLSIDSKTR